MKKKRMTDSSGNEIYEYAFSAVPKEKRKPANQLIVILIGWAFSVSGLIMGVKIGSEMTFVHAFLACMAGNLVLFLLTLFWGMMGYKTGYASVTLVKSILGKRVADLFSILLIVVLVIWMGMNGEWLANLMLAVIPGWILPSQITALLVVALATCFSLYGWKSMMMVAGAAVPCMLCISVYNFIRIREFGEGFAVLAEYQPMVEMSIPVAFFITIGNFAVPSAAVPSLFRFAKNRRTVLVGTVAYTLTLIAGNLLGILAAQVARTNNLIYAIDVLGILVSSFLCLMLCAYTTQNANMYTGSLALQDLIRETPLGGNLSHRTAVLFMGGVAAIVASTGSGRYLPELSGLLAPGILLLTGVAWAKSAVSKKE